MKSINVYWTVAEVDKNQYEAKCPIDRAGRTFFARDFDQLYQTLLGFTDEAIGRLSDDEMPTADVGAPGDGVVGVKVRTGKGIPIFDNVNQAIPVQRHCLVTSVILEPVTRGGIAIAQGEVNRQRTQRFYFVEQVAEDCRVVKPGDLIIVSQKSAHHPMGHSVTPLIDQNNQGYYLFHEADVAMIVARDAAAADLRREDLEKVDSFELTAHQATGIMAAMAMKNSTKRLSGHVER